MIITFWISRESNLSDHRFVATILKPYGLQNDDNFRLRILREDFAHPSHTNIFLISATCRHANPSGRIEDFHVFRSDNDVQYAREKGMQVVIDYSWEYLGPYEYYAPDRKKGHIADFHDNNHDYIMENDIKVLTTPVWYKKQQEEYDRRVAEGLTDRIDIEEFNRIMLPFDTFRYELRCSKAKTFNYDLETHNSPREDKKYFFSMFIGDVFKIQNMSLGAHLYEYGLNETQAYSHLSANTYTHNVEKWKMLGRSIRTQSENYHKDQLPVVELIEKWQDTLHKNMPHERYTNHGDYIDNFVERRMPQVAFDSHLYAAVETTNYWGCSFYTEKAYKPIMHGLPFVIIGGPWQNENLKEKGYEIFDEVIDYSFEQNILMENSCSQLKMSNAFMKELQRLIDVGPDAFYQTSVLEKIQHNKNNFDKLSTRKNLIKEIKELFGDL